MHTAVIPHYISHELNQFAQTKQTALYLVELRKCLLGKTTQTFIQYTTSLRLPYKSVFLQPTGDTAIILLVQNVFLLLIMSRRRRLDWKSASAWPEEIGVGSKCVRGQPCQIHTRCPRMFL